MKERFPHSPTTPERRAEYTSRGWWTGDVVTHRLAQLGASFPDRIAIVDNVDGGSYTYERLSRDVTTLASTLVRHGISEGDVACVQLPNWYEAAVAALGCMAAGCVVNPLLPTYRQNELNRMFTAVSPAVIFTPITFRGHDYVPLIAEVADRTGVEPWHVTVRGRHEGVSSLEDLMGTSPQDDDQPELPIRDPRGVVEILFTSGTSAEPKAVLHSEEGLNFNMRSTAEWLALGPDTTVWMPSPVGHSTGFNYGIRIAAYHGWKLVLQERWSVSDAAMLISREGCNFTLASTTFLQDLVDHLQETGETLPMLTHFSCGGAPVPSTLIKSADAVGITVLRLYGATELLNTTWNRRSDPPDKRRDTDGLVMDGVEVRIENDEGRDVVAGERGEIVTRSPGTCIGYVGQTMDRAAGGWIRSGDVGTVDAEGYLRVVGRKKEIIIRGGMNIAPAEIESLLLEIDGVKRASVIGLPDRRLGERVCACIIGDGDRRFTLAEITDELRGRGVAVYKLPEAIAVVTEMPTTASGKIRKDLLLESVLVEGPTEMRQSQP